MNQLDRIKRKAEEAQDLQDFIHATKLLLWDIGSLESIPKEIEGSFKQARDAMFRMTVSRDD